MEVSMKKAWLIAMIIVLLFIIGIFTGIYSYHQQNAKDSNPKGTSQLAQEENTQIGTIKPANLTVETASNQTKISPNCILTKKQYYQDCDHLIKKQEIVPEYLVNKSEEELKQAYPGWTIEEFSSDQITLYRESAGYCDQHYVIRENNGVLAIYTLDVAGNEIWKEDTDIQTMYLTPTDLEKVREGMKAIGDEELNSILEDFE